MPDLNHQPRLSLHGARLLAVRPALRTLENRLDQPTTRAEMTSRLAASVEDEEALKARLRQLKYRCWQLRSM